MKKIKKRWKFLRSYVVHYKRYWIGGISCIVFSTALDQIPPWSIKIILDMMTEGAPMMKLLHPLVFIAGAVLISCALTYFQRQWVIQSSRKMEYEIRNDLYKDLQRQPKIFYDTISVGEIMSHATNDLDRIRDLLGPVVLHLVRIVCLAAYTLVCIWLLSPRLLFLGLVPAIILPLFVNRLLKKMHALYASIQKDLGVLNAFVQDAISGIQVVKAYGKEGIFQKKFAASSDALRGHSLRVAYFTSALWPFIGLLSSLGILLVIWFGATMVAEKAITIGTLTAVIIYLLRLQFPIAGLGWVANLLQRSNAAIDRMVNLREKFHKASAILSPAAPPPRLAASRIKKSVTLELKGLSFSYNHGPQVLKNIHLDIPQGSSLGMVGPIGSGKSTLIHIICGIYLPPPQQLYLDGRPREEIDDQEWWPVFSLAPQDGFLFSQSISDNILLGENASSIHSVKEAGELSGLSKDLNQIPGGYQAILGERGINLSGGQRQRVGLARSILSHTTVLCLDDTLSALDSETEKYVLENLKQRLSGRTMIIASHRYTSVSFCDSIIYLEQGRIVERGDHQTLLAKGGKYAHVYNKQMLTRELDKS